MGARPLRRVIQEQIEDRIADYVLDHSDTHNLVAKLDDNGDIVVEETEEVPTIAKKVTEYKNEAEFFNLVFITLNLLLNDGGLPIPEEQPSGQ